MRSYKISFTKKQALSWFWSTGYSLPLPVVDPFSSSEFWILMCQSCKLLFQEQTLLDLLWWENRKGHLCLSFLCPPDAMSSLLNAVRSLEADARWLYQASPFALWLLVDFSALETMAGIQSMGGKLRCLFLPPLCWQWFEETEFLSSSPSSLQLPVLFRSRTLDCFFGMLS